jgi:peptidoglycan/LPS O-acetylase OafA/YrhL
VKALPVIRGTGRILALDTIRGIAILMVILHHAGPEMIPNQPQVDGASGFAFWALKNLGWTGVDLFFVLSGYLIGGLLLSELDRHGRIGCGRFWLRRGLKIWPSYFALLAVLAGIEATRWIDLASPGSTANDLLVHGLFLQNYLDRGVNGPTWSLAVEEHFYLLLPLLLLVVGRGGGAAGAGLARYHAFFALSLAGGMGLRVWHVLVNDGPEVNDFMLSHFRFDSLILGVALQFYRRRFPGQARLLARRYWWLLLPFAVGLLLPSISFSRNDALMFGPGFTGLAIGYAILIGLALEFLDSRLGDGAALRPVARMGCWSYNIYLWHYFVPFVVPGYWQLQSAVGSLDAPAPLVLTLQALIYVAVSVTLGAVMTRWVEVPFLRLRDRWAPARGVRSQRAASVAAAAAANRVVPETTS